MGKKRLETSIPNAPVDRWVCSGRKPSDMSQRCAARRADPGCSSVLAAYPEKPIQYLIPFTPGGESDFVARMHLECFARSTTSR